MSAEYAGCLHRLQHAIQALALPADAQLLLFPDFVCKVDELALDYDNWFRCVRSNDKLTDLQSVLLGKIDKMLDEMSGAENADLWTETALYNNLSWNQVRVLAKETLAAFNWPEEVPPSYAHEYFPGARPIYIEGKDK